MILFSQGVYPSNLVRLTYRTIPGFQVHVGAPSRDKGPDSTIRADGSVMIRAVRSEHKFLVARIYHGTSKAKFKVKEFDE